MSDTLKVKWGPLGHCDGDFGMHGSFANDTLNDWGLQLYHLIYPRGKGTRETDTFWFVRGHEGEIRTKSELIEVLQKLGHLPKCEESEQTAS